MVPDRALYLTRAWRYAKLTIPALLPEEGTWSKGSALPEPWQSKGAEAVNTLGSKLLLTLLPVNLNFFRLKPDESEFLANPEAEQNRTQIEDELASIEKVVLEDLEYAGIRVKFYEVLRQLAVAGNVVLHIPLNQSGPRRPPRVYKLDSFVARRDPRGGLLEIIVHEQVDPMSLSPAMRERLRVKASDNETEKERLDLYTQVRKQEDGTWVERQEVQGIIDPSSVINHGEKVNWIAPRVIAEDGADYGRSLCEEYGGDLRVLDYLHQAIAKGAIGSARLKFLVNPNGRTHIRDLEESEDGAFVAGREEDVRALQVNKQADLAVAASEIERLERRIDRVFMISHTRDAERVTAAEIFRNANDLETNMGGIFTRLSEELQRPMVETALHAAEASGRIEKVSDIVRVAIVTGLEAIGRGHDLQRLDEWMRGAAELGLTHYIKGGNLLKQRGIALGVETEEVLFTEEEMAQQRQAEAQQEMVQKLGPTAMKEYTPDQLQEAAQAMQQ